MWVKDSRPFQELCPLLALLGFDLLCALAVVRKVPFQYPNYEHACDALEFLKHGRIASDFLPVGYSGLLGLSAAIAGVPGAIALCVLLSLAVIAAAWAYLRTLGLSVRATLLITALLSLYPDFLLSYDKAWDTAPTAIVLFAFLALLFRSIREVRFGAADAFLALTVGYGIVLRPNLAGLLPLVWVVYWRQGVERRLSRCLGQLALAAVTYAAMTTAFHGKPFFPRNGPYNLYAGANEYTETFIANEEDSLPPALLDHGIRVAAPAACSPATDRGGLPDMREAKLDPLYRRFALEFVRAHPGAALRLVGVKFRNMMFPDYRLHSLLSLGGCLKTLAALAFPLWLAACIFLPHPGPRGTRFTLLALTALYIAPFLLTVSSPRFRTPLDFLLWVDLGAIVAARWRGAYLTSLPRPSA